MNTIDQPPIGNQSLPEGQIGAFLNLDYVVRNMQMELEDYSMRQYKRLLQLVINGLGLLRIYHAGAIQVAYLKVNSAGIVVFPQDYIKYSKIGVYIHGRLVTLTLNNNMALNRAQVCTEDIRVMEKENGIALISGLNDGYYFAPHFRDGNFIGGLYGAGGGFNQAYYRIDDVKKQMQFNGYIPRGEIVLEYASSGISAGTVISRAELDPLKKYAHQYRVEYRDDVPLSTKVRREDQFDKSVVLLRAFEGSFTLSEYLDAMYKNHKQSPKV